MRSEDHLALGLYLLPRENSPQLRRHCIAFLIGCIEPDYCNAAGCGRSKAEMKYDPAYIEPQKLYLLLGERIRRLRRYYQLSEKIGSTQKYVSRIELGFARPNLSVYLKISNALHTSMDTLLCDLIAAGNDACIDDLTEQALATELMQIIQKYLDNR